MHVIFSDEWELQMFQIGKVTSRSFKVIAFGANR